MHAAAIPDADPATLKRPEDAARELVDAIVAAGTGYSFAPLNPNVSTHNEVNTTR